MKTCVWSQMTPLTSRRNQLRMGHPRTDNGRWSRANPNVSPMIYFCCTAQQYCTRYLLLRVPTLLWFPTTRTVRGLRGQTETQSKQFNWGTVSKKADRVECPTHDKTKANVLLIALLICFLSIKFIQYTWYIYNIMYQQ